jgi:hypothetical protein
MGSFYTSFRAGLNSTIATRLSQTINESASELSNQMKKNARKAPLQLIDQSKLVGKFAGRGPQVDTSLLIKGIGVAKRSTPATLEAIVVSRAPYSLPVELGTLRSRAFPFTQAAIEAIRPKHKARIKAAMGMT